MVTFTFQTTKKAEFLKREMIYKTVNNYSFKKTKNRVTKKMRTDF